MSSDSSVFTGENLNDYLKAVAKEYKKMGGKAMPAELILIGGAAVIANYGFREMTTDIDAIIHAASVMKDAINSVGDQYHLQNGWLRTVQAEYLIAMKLRSGRLYKNDRSDIAGILAEHEKRGEPITMDRITQAVTNLYGGWEQISASSQLFIQQIMQNGEYQKTYGAIRQEEQDNKELLISFESKYPGATTSENVERIITDFKKKQKRNQTLNWLKNQKQENAQDIEADDELDQ